MNWHVIHRGHIAIAKTTKIERLSENLKVYDFTHTAEEYAAIDVLNCNARFFNPVQWAHFLNAPLFE
jgi:diketogulonate reductase-like aldo/keto reductase